MKILEAESVLDQQQSRDLMYLSVSYLCIMAYKINKGIHMLNDNHELLATIFEPKVIVDTMWTRPLKMNLDTTLAPGKMVCVVMMINFVSRC